MLSRLNGSARLLILVLEPAAAMTDSSGARAPSPAPALKPPALPRAAAPPVKASRHGVILTDEFAWLKDANWQAVMRDPGLLDPVIREHLQGENTYADAVLASTLSLQETLVAEMRGRIKEEDASVPAADGAFSHFTRYRGGGQHPSICREPRGGGAGEILIDGDALAVGKAFFRLGATAHSPDHKLLAWSADETGAELFTVQIRDLARMAELSDIVPETAGAIVSPGDGRVTDISTLELAGVPRTRISIFLSVFDVHVNRSPVSGIIRNVEYRKGQFRNAMGADSADFNEQNIVSVEDGGQTVVFKQIAGLIARRIVFTKRVNDTVARGERIGMIKFGSRVDVLFDARAAVQVKVGQHVAGGTTVLALAAVEDRRAAPDERELATAQQGGRR